MVFILSFGLPSTVAHHRYSKCRDSFEFGSGSLVSVPVVLRLGFEFRITESFH